LGSDSLWQRFCGSPFSSRAPLPPSRPLTFTQMHTCSGIMFASPPQPLPCLKSRRLCGHRLGMPDMSTTTVTRGHAKINRRLFPNTRNTARDRPSCPHSKAALLPIFKNPILGPYDQVQRVSVRTHARRISARCTLETGRRARATSAHTHFARMTYHVKRQSHGECVHRRRWNIHTQTLARTRPNTHTQTHTHTHRP
jgi:hypothetical protein